MARVVEESIEVQVRRKLVKRSQYFVVFQVDVRQDFEVVLPQGLCEFVHVIFGAAEVVDLARAVGGVSNQQSELSRAEGNAPVS